ncbi:26S protease regulatory subunit [Entamoeba marina]
MEIDPERKSVLKAYLQKVKTLEAKEVALAKIKDDLKTAKNTTQRNDEMLLSLQAIGMNIADVLKCLDGDKYIVKVSLGPHYVVGCRNAIDKSQLTQGTRVALDMATNTIMRVLPREVHPMVHAMAVESPGNVAYSEIGGLRNQMREIREVIELPMTNPELFERVGVKAPKGVLLYGPPGTGKTLLARALASNLDCHFLKVVASEMFAFARDHQPCVIFMDEIDAIAGKRIAEGIHSDREIQRTLMELLAQMDGFTEVNRVKVIMATNRPDVLDPALLRPGRLDRKIEICLPNDQGRIEILKIHSKRINIKGDMDFETMAKLSDGFNGADLRNVCTEAGMFAVRDDRDYCKLENQFGDVKL